METRKPHTPTQTPSKQPETPNAKPQTRASHGWCWAEIQQFAPIGPSSSLRWAEFRFVSFRRRRCCRRCRCCRCRRRRCAGLGFGFCFHARVCVCRCVCVSGFASPFVRVCSIFHAGFHASFFQSGFRCFSMRVFSAAAAAAASERRVEKNCRPPLLRLLPPAAATAAATAAVDARPLRPQPPPSPAHNHPIKI